MKDATAAVDILVLSMEVEEEALMAWRLRLAWSRSSSRGARSTPPLRATMDRRDTAVPLASPLEGCITIKNDIQNAVTHMSFTLLLPPCCCLHKCIL